MSGAPEPARWRLNGDPNGSHVAVQRGADGYSAVLVLSGEHDISTKSEVETALAPLYGRVLVDLSECTFIDSTVIGLVIEKSRRLVRDGQSLELLISSTSSPVTIALTLMRIAEVVPVHSKGTPSLEEQGNEPEPATSRRPDGQLTPIKPGSRVKTKDGDIGRVQRLDADRTIAHIRLDDPPPRDGTPLEVAGLELDDPTGRWV